MAHLGDSLGSDELAEDVGVVDVLVVVVSHINGILDHRDTSVGDESARESTINNVSNGIHRKGGPTRESGPSRC